MTALKRRWFIKLINQVQPICQKKNLGDVPHMKTVKCFTFLKQHCFFAFIVPHMQKKQKKAKSSHSVSLLALLIKPPSCLVQFFYVCGSITKRGRNVVSDLFNVETVSPKNRGKK